MNLERDITSPYSRAEAWLYDRLVAPAVEEDFMARLTALQEMRVCRFPATGSILDLGCGGGQITIALARRYPALFFKGIDSSEGQIRRARRRSREIPNVEFEVGNAMDLAAEEGSFDGLVSIACLKHWPDRSRGLRECLRVVRPGSAMIIVEADKECSDQAALEFVSEWRMPSFLRRRFAKFFRETIAGQSLTRGEAEELVAATPLVESRVFSPTKAPILIISAVKDRD
jgi:ubiquinone/menaquinone biosynthesis C-methylase UbiE